MVNGMSSESLAAPKLILVPPPHGPVLVSADLHGHLGDFERLAELFVASHARGEDPVWIGVGDWLHGPNSDEPSTVTDAHGEPLYDYPDQSPEVLTRLFALMDAHPGRIFSVLGNHEHAHLGGPRTSKFHDDEAVALEARMTADQIADMKRRFRSWPIAVAVPALGLVVTHGALGGPIRNVAELEQIRWEGQMDAHAYEIARSMVAYGYVHGGDRRLLDALSVAGPAYRLIIHGHDRDEDGYSASGEHALLLCSSFGARRDTKTYVWLTSPCSLAELRLGHELRRLYP